MPREILHCVWVATLNRWGQETQTASVTLAGNPILPFLYGHQDLLLLLLLLLVVVVVVVAHWVPDNFLYIPPSVYNWSFTPQIREIQIVSIVEYLQFPIQNRLVTKLRVPLSTVLNFNAMIQSYNWFISIQTTSITWFDWIPTLNSNGVLWHTSSNHENTIISSARRIFPIRTYSMATEMSTRVWSNASWAIRDETRSLNRQSDKPLNFKPSYRSAPS